MLTVIRKQQNPDDAFFLKYSDDAFAISISSPWRCPKKKKIEITAGD